MSPKESQSLYTKITAKIQKDGILSLMTAAPRYVYSEHLRQHLLTHNRVILYNGIESPYKVSIFDRIVPGYTPPNDKQNYEFAEVDAIRKYSEKGDNVVIVGAGRGITATVAANSVGEEGRVTAYEASTDRISRVQKTIQHNDVGNIVKICHRIVAKAQDVSGNIGSASTITPEDLPKCDFLELDCEGAEGLILEEMTIKPRVISVETHETKGVSHSNILKLLKDRGYNIIEEIDRTDQNEGTRHIVSLLEK